MPPEPGAREYLLSLEQIGIKLGLEQIRALVAALDHPDRAFRSIIIAGTNGKGSVTAMVERGLRAAGYRTGRYTSPHLTALEERVAIDGAAIAPAVLDAAAERVRTASAGLAAPPSFFEATTALALDVFREAHVDVAVLEVGLGGRLDATNVTTPIAGALTQIDFDHQQYLGDTIEAIAGEKAGVIKPGMVVVLGENGPRVHDIVAAASRTNDATLVRATDGTTASWRTDEGTTRLTLETPRDRYDGLRLALRGRHQIQNAVTAIRLLEEIDGRGHFVIGNDAVRAAVEQVEWPARLELLTSADGDVLLDGAHNPAGARALASYLRETFERPLPLVLGMMRDKQAAEIIAALLPVVSHMVLTAPATPRAADPSVLAAIVSDMTREVPVFVVPDPARALARARSFGSPVVVAGSLYLAGEIRAVLS